MKNVPRCMFEKCSLSDVHIKNPLQQLHAARDEFPKITRGSTPLELICDQNHFL